MEPETTNIDQKVLECIIAKFSSIEAATECKTCPAGFTSKKVGSTLCEQCVGGSKIKCSLVLVSCSYSYIVQPVLESQ